MLLPDGEVVSTSSATSPATPWPRALAFLPRHSDVQARGKAMATLEPWRQAVELLQAMGARSTQKWPGG